jgi:peptidoglycan/xylan/chitin deacetylase (PgdA/CDA1 family)
MIIGLRHDIDTSYGLRQGLPKIISLEEKYDVRSTFFVRVDILHSDRDIKILRWILDGGWEIGLHLINTIDDLRLPSPESELEVLKNLFGDSIYGVTPCGSTIGFKGDTTWRVMDSLGLKYMEGYGLPRFAVNTFVIPTHLSLDIHYVRNFGEVKGYEMFKKALLEMLEKNGVATVLTHPEWFVRSVGGCGLIKIPLTLLRRKMMDKVYDIFLQEFKDKVKFKRYVDVFRLLRSTE